MYVSLSQPLQNTAFAVRVLSRKNAKILIYSHNLLNIKCFIEIETKYLFL